MFLSDLSIKRPVLVTMLILVFLVFGGLAYIDLSLNMMPDVDIPVVTVQLIYAGASPLEVESQIIKPVEDAVSTVSKIDYIESYSMESVGYVIVRFEMGKDVDIANQEVKDKIDAILNDFPDDAEKPVISKFDMGAFPIVELVLGGDKTPIELYEIADKQLKDRFSQIEGVASVNISGGQEREVRVEFNDRVVMENNISLSQMAQILAAQNLDMPGGHFLQKDQEYSIRLEGEFESVDQLNNMEVATSKGIKKLKQIASVVDTGAEIRERSVYFNNIEKVRDPNVVRLSILKSSDGNVVEVADEVIKALPEIEEALPEGLELNLVDDSSNFIRSSVEDTLSNIILGIIFTGIVLLIFLHDWRSTLIVALAMPTSIISTFMLMQAFDFTINIMTLMGLSVSVGVLVTNSVVVLENIFRHKRLGEKRMESAAIGTSEVAVAVIASTMTNVVVFLPIASMSSIVGQFFTEFALTVTFATIFSLLISFTMTPMLSSRFLPVQMKKGRLGAWIEKQFDAIDHWYGRLLTVLFRKKRYTAFLMLGTVALLVGSFMLAGKIGFEFMPLMDEGNIKLEAELPQGYNLSQTADVLEQIEKTITAHPEVKHVLTTIGKVSDTDVGTNLAYANIKLIDAELRTLTTAQVNDILIKDLSTIPNTRIKLQAVSSAGDQGGPPIEFYLKGQEIEELSHLNDQIIEKMKSVPGLVNFDSSLRSGKPEITIVPNRRKLMDAGASVYDIAMALRASVEGIVATEYKENSESYDLRICMTDESVDSPEKVKNIPVVTPTGTYRISQLADVDFSVGVNKVIHRDKYKTVKLTGSNANGVALGDVVSVINQGIAEIDLPSGYTINWGGDVEMMNDMIMDIGRAFLLAILLTYMLLAAILESFVQPLLILSTLPLALIGVFGALYMTGLTMNMFSMMAIVMLVGIVVNNAILLLEYTNQLRKEGKNPHDALIEACPTKLKPILMSSLAIMLGMLPMAMGIGSAGKEFRQAMGVVSIGGLIVSTFLTLIVIPSFYYLTTRRQKKNL